MQTRQLTAGEDCAELLAQQLRSFKTQANAAQAEERIGFAVHRHISQRFVATDIEGAHHQIVCRPDGARDGAVGGHLFIVARRLLATQVEKFRTQQANATCAQLHGLGGFALRGNVGGDFDVLTVTGTSRLAGLRQFLLMTLALALMPRAQLIDGLGVRVQLQFAFVGIEQHPRAVAEPEHLQWHTADRRQTAGSREDRDMAGGATANGGKPEHLARIEPGGLGRGQLIGDQNGVVRQLQRLLVNTEDQLQHALADIIQIRRALSQQGIAQRAKHRRRCIGAGLPGKRRAFARVNQRPGLIQQARVGQQFLMRLENLRLRLAAGGVAQMLQGHVGFDQGLAQRLPFAWRLGAELVDRERRFDDLHDLSQRRTGRGADTAQDVRHFCCIGFDRCGRCHRFAAAFAQQACQRCDRCFGIFTFGADLHAVAMGRLQRHDCHQGFAVGLRLQLVQMNGR